MNDHSILFDRTFWGPGHLKSKTPPRSNWGKSGNFHLPECFVSGPAAEASSHEPCHHGKCTRHQPASRPIHSQAYLDLHEMPVEGMMSVLRFIRRKQLENVSARI